MSEISDAQLADFIRVTDVQRMYSLSPVNATFFREVVKELQRRRSHPTIPKGDLEAAREWLLIKYAVYPDIPHDVAGLAALLTATRADQIERDARIAVAAVLLEDYQWGHDAREQFDFGKQRAALAIRQQLGGK